MDILKEIANRLDGIERDCLEDEINQIKNLYKQQIQEDKICIIYGASDDLIEFEGYIYDELGAYNGFSISDLNFKDEDCCMDHKLKELKNSGLTSVWCPVDENENIIASWVLSVNDEIQHEKFSVIDEGEIFQIALVLKVA